MPNYLDWLATVLGALASLAALAIVVSAIRPPRERRPDPTTVDDLAMQRIRRRVAR